MTTRAYDQQTVNQMRADLRAIDAFACYRSSSGCKGANPGGAWFGGRRRRVKGIDLKSLVTDLRAAGYDARRYYSRVWIVYETNRDRAKVEVLRNGSFYWDRPKITPEDVKVLDIIRDHWKRAGLVEGGE